MQNKKVLLAVLLSFVLLAALPLMSAAVTVVKPVTSTNYSTTMNVTVTTGYLDWAGKYINVTCWYNATGTPATPLVTITNTSVNQTWFSNAAVDISAITEGLNYSVICGARNGTAAFDVNSTAVLKVGIDNTDPVVTIEASKPSIGVGNTQEITWTSSDAMTGLSSTLVTVSSPNSDRCADQTWTTASGTSVAIVTEGGVADCSGTWTATILATDKAGNTETTSATWQASDNGAKAGYLQGTSATDESEGLSPIVVFIIAGIAIYFLFFRKKKAK